MSTPFAVLLSISHRRRFAISANGPLFLGVAGIVASAVACEPVEPEGPTGPVDPPSCPLVLPTAATSCSEPGCAATTGTRTITRSDLAATDASRWLVIAHAGSDLFDNQNLTLTYEEETVGALTPAAGPTVTSSARTRSSAKANRLKRHARLRAQWGDDVYKSIFGAERRRRIETERRIRAASPRAPLSLRAPATAIRGLNRARLPPGARAQQASCTLEMPQCGSTSLCIISEGSTQGTCESSLSIKFRPDPSTPSSFDTVNATVRAVGNFGAIVVDDADAASVSAQDVDDLLDRFERRIAPLDHAFFGLPRDQNGNDRDGNGVVILFMTSRVSQVGAGIVGFFQSLDLRPESEVASSNAADILYLQPPGASISLDQLSGTIGHEYQHLINYYAKVINRGSSPEAVWLDEGLSTFAEDMLGYGGDAFRNVAAYLEGISDTSITGFGLLFSNDNDADSMERRGAAHLLVRYHFEQAGGANFSSDPSVVNDLGGVAAVRQLVQNDDTGIEAFSGTGRRFSQWVQDLLTAVAIDGAGIPNVSCNPDFTFASPETDAFTGFQRGLDLRTPIRVPGGAMIPLNGPATLSFESESVPVPLNGGEIRTLETPNGTTRIRLIGPVDDDIEMGLRIIATAPAP